MLATLKQPADRYLDLTPGQPYAVIGIETETIATFWRVVNQRLTLAAAD